MRFILNFIFFGILFYLIWVYFPDAFTTMVSWADTIVTFIKDVFQLVVDKLGISTPTTTPPPTK